MAKPCVFPFKYLWGDGGEKWVEYNNCIHVHTELGRSSKLGPKRQTTDLNVKTGWYHARGDTLPPFSYSFVLRREWGRVSFLTWYQPVLTSRSVVCRLCPGKECAMGILCGVPLQSLLKDVLRAWESVIWPNVKVILISFLNNQMAPLFGIWWPFVT